MISRILIVNLAQTYFRRQFSNTLLNEKEIKVTYHYGLWVVFILLQESSHGKHNGAEKM